MENINIIVEQNTENINVSVNPPAAPPENIILSLNQSGPEGNIAELEDLREDVDELQSGIGNFEMDFTLNYQISKL